MFSGIIAALGRITELTPRNDGTPTVRLNVEAGRLGLEDVAPGDSIACSGVCLTVVGIQDNSFSVDASPDTLGGHLVSGHVDGVGEVLRFDPVGDNRLLEIRAPEALAKYIARKGSITVNGVSLTTNSVDGACFSINLIPHTLDATTLGSLKPGSRVNLEIDLIARYVERMLDPDAPESN